MEQRLREQIARIIEPSMDRLKYRDDCLKELREIGSTKALPFLSKLLADADGEYRCEAALLILSLGSEGIPLVLPLLRDSQDWVRWNVAGYLGDFGETVIEPLIEVLKTDADPGVRGQAASALGRVGSPQSIPPLLEALDHDNETDSLGYSPSFIASQALDNILGSNETRIKLSDGYCKLAPWEPNLEALKSRRETAMRSG
jgi:HEAT repeat protein